ncbi:MAG TPA: hypothetical protein VFV35_03130 [Acidimicrobiales bacterium]|nr:hypothetical protein [Acidimicrobiales bacterium]
MGARYVVLGLALSRSPWFRSVAQWAHSASIPVEFIKVASPVELRAHLASGRTFSALLVDAGVPHIDRDLVEEVRATGCAVVVVDDVRVTRDWAGLGADAVINPVFDRQALLDVLASRAPEVSRVDRLPSDADAVTGRPPEALVVMVCGAGGTGSSSVAMAIAQGLAGDRDESRQVLLADFARRADQAMLHDAGDVVPGVQELVEAHRSARPSVDEVRSFTFAVEQRGYHLLLGLRRPRNWATIRPRAFRAAIESLTEAFDVVVGDCDADIEGEREGGSADVEERNVMARTVAELADLVVLVGEPSMKGIHSLVLVMRDLLEFGVPAASLLPVVNRAPRHPRARSGIARSLAALVPDDAGSATAASPVFLPEVDVDAAMRDGVRLPSRYTIPIASVVTEMVSRNDGKRALGAREPERVAPGSLGSWSEELR